MTTTPPPEGTTEPRRPCAPGCTMGPDHFGGPCCVCGPGSATCKRSCPSYRPVPPAPAAEDDAVERGITATTTLRVEVGDPDDGPPTTTREALARMAEHVDTLRRERDEARQQVADLRAVALGKVRHVWAGLCPDDVEGWETRDPECPACRILSAALAEGGEAGETCRVCQGEGRSCRPDPLHPGHWYCSRGPAPVVPDSADVREHAECVAIAVLEDDESEGLDAFDLGVKIARAVLAVVGQGVTAEQALPDWQSPDLGAAWDEGYREGQHYWMLGRPNPHRAVVRSGEQGGDRG